MGFTFNILAIFFLCVLGLNVFYFLFFSVAAFFNKSELKATVTKMNRFIVLIPSYKADDVIHASIQENFKQSYPISDFEIMVIADGLSPLTVGSLKLYPLRIIEVSFEKSTKAKSLNAAIDAIGDDHFDYAVLLDIDNVMDTEFLKKLNENLQHNEVVIQGHRVAKNLDSDFAILDAISEEINNNIFRRGHKALGLSAAFIGSAKAIRYDIFKRMMPHIDAVGGFDKELEFRLIQHGYKIYYDHTALVFDEKVQSPLVYQNQRRRWLSAQFTYMKRYAVTGLFQGIVRRNADLFDKSIQFLLIPRVITLGFLLIFSSTYLLDFHIAKWFIILLLMNVLAMVLAIPSRFFRFRYLQSARYFPKAFLLMFFNFFKLRGANDSFIHTPHRPTKQGTQH